MARWQLTVRVATYLDPNPPVFKDKRVLRFYVKNSMLLNILKFLKRKLRQMRW